MSWCLRHNVKQNRPVKLWRVSELGQEAVDAPHDNRFCHCDDSDSEERTPGGVAVEGVVISGLA